MFPKIKCYQLEYLFTCWKSPKILTWSLVQPNCIFPILSRYHKGWSIVSRGFPLLHTHSPTEPGSDCVWPHVCLQVMATSLSQLYRYFMRNSAFHRTNRDCDNWTTTHLHKWVHPPNCSTSGEPSSSAPAQAVWAGPEPSADICVLV